MTSEVGQHIQKWIICQANQSYTNFALRWDPIQFKDNRHLQKYEETNGSISYLKSNTVKQLESLRKYMTLLISQDRPADHNYNLFYFILGEQLFKLTAIDMKTALINELLENPRSQTTPGTPMSNSTYPSSSASVRSPMHLELASFKKGIKSDDPSQDVDKSHLSDSTSTTTTLNETCSLNTSCDHLLHLDSPSLSSELQDNSIVGSTEPESVPDFEDLFQFNSASVSSQDTSSIEIEFLPEFEGQLDHANLSPTDVFLEHHDYELFLLHKQTDAPYDNLSHQDTCL